MERQTVALGRCGRTRHLRGTRETRVSGYSPEGRCQGVQLDGRREIARREQGAPASEGVSKTDRGIHVGTRATRRNVRQVGLRVLMEREQRQEQLKCLCGRGARAWRGRREGCLGVFCRRSCLCGRGQRRANGEGAVDGSEDCVRDRERRDASSRASRGTRWEMEEREEETERGRGRRRRGRRNGGGVKRMRWWWEGKEGGWLSERARVTGQRLRIEWRWTCLRFPNSGPFFFPRFVFSPFLILLAESISTIPAFITPPYSLCTKLLPHRFRSTPRQYALFPGATILIATSLSFTSTNYACSSYGICSRSHRS